MDFTRISFPGIGIEPFRINNFAFGKINWSTLIILAGAILAFFYVALHAKKRGGIKKRITLAMTGAALLLGVIFARATYVIATWDTIGYTGFGEMAAFWDGMSFGGALFGGLLAIAIMCDVFKMNGLRVFDLFLPGLLLVQTVAAIGTFLDANIYGAVIGETTSFWCVGGACEMASGEGTLLSLIRMTIDKGGEVLAYHPVFLYQFVWGLIGYVVAHFVSNRARFKGQVTLFYFTWLGFGSALLAGLNAPENGGVNGAQLFWLIIGVLALAAFIVRALLSVNRGITVEGEAPEKRSFSQMMTADERIEKREQDVACITAILDEKADSVYAEMTAEPAEENAEEEVVAE